MFLFTFCKESENVPVTRTLNTVNL